MSLKLLVDPETDQILGAQGVGHAGVDKRIDVIATAMAGSLTASDLADLELAYAPQFVKVWRTRSTQDISLGMLLVMVLGLMLWLLYGLLSGDAPLVAANAITIVLAGGILVMKLKYG